MSTSSPRFHCLTVRDVRRETADAVSVAFEVPAELAGAYAFEPGQYLTLRATLEGEDMRRSYSICSGPDDGELRVAVKQVDGGIFSTWINTALAAGDRLDVMTPTGRFGLRATAGRPQTYVGIAAGSGITPILSLIRGILAGERDSRFFLFYGNRSSAGVLFNEALQELKDRYLGRLSVFHVLSQEEQDLAVLNGRLDGDKVRLLLSSLVPASMVDQAFICGPEGMAEEIAPVLESLGITREQIHVERFVSALGGRPRAKPAAVPSDASTVVATVIFDGKRRDIPVAESEAILDAAIRAGVDLPYACKGGMCATCRARVTSGSAVMDVNYSLEPWELESGYVLTCQAHPQTDRIVVDYDHV
jgi:ring-1,2-phenylacetyl-CoA epoxidase subunit PaaE